MKLIPTIIQDYKTNDVLMLGYMNKKSLEKTLRNGFVWFWSRSKKRLWMKGETSENKLEVKEIFNDCDKDTLLIKVKVIGNAVCHTGKKTCFSQGGVTIPPLRWKGEL